VFVHKQGPLNAKSFNNIVIEMSMTMSWISQYVLIRVMFGYKKVGQ